MRKSIQNTFFYTIDLFLPRFIAVIPYNIALRSLILKMAVFNNVQVWDRNSIRRGNFIFGVSDLDITILITGKMYTDEANEINRILKEHKMFFPFLGETNFYLDDLSGKLAPSLNYYERLRDPILSNKLINIDYDDLNVEKATFLLRMIYADRVKLGKMTFLRQKKWKGHFSDLGFNIPDKVSIENVLENLLELLKLNATLEKKLMEVIRFVLTTDLNEQNIYHIELPELWKFIFPHKHIWFDYDRVENFDIIKGTLLEKVCLRQLEWEIWGLMSQVPFLPSIEENLVKHLKRQARAALALDHQSPVDAMVIQLNEALEDFKLN